MTSKQTKQQVKQQAAIDNGNKEGLKRLIAESKDTITTFKATLARIGEPQNGKEKIVIAHVRNLIENEVNFIATATKLIG